MNPDPGHTGRTRRLEILRGPGRFREIFVRGTRISGRHVGCVYLIREGIPGARVGFVASSKAMNAVARNRFKRLMREAVRRIDLQHGQKIQGVDIIFTPEPGWKTIPTYEEIRSDVDRLVREIEASPPTTQ